jgi:phytoene dehydrogenase-like protein
MKSFLQFNRFREVQDATYDAITEMDHLAADLREVLTEHGVRIAKGADVDG